MALPDNLRHFRKVRGPRARRVAFVFQGGGSLAAPQVGMLRALAAAGLRPDLVIGSSAGALNAVTFAGDPSEAVLAPVVA
jgi:NTE family protein